MIGRCRSASCSVVSLCEITLRVARDMTARHTAMHAAADQAHMREGSLDKCVHPAAAAARPHSPTAAHSLGLGKIGHNEARDSSWEAPKAFVDGERGVQPSLIAQKECELHYFPFLT